MLYIAKMLAVLSIAEITTLTPKYTRTTTSSHLEGRWFGQIFLHANCWNQHFFVPKVRVNLTQPQQFVVALSGSRIAWLSVHCRTDAHSFDYFVGAINVQFSSWRKVQIGMTILLTRCDAWLINLMDVVVRTIRGIFYIFVVEATAFAEYFMVSVCQFVWHSLALVSNSITKST